MHAVIFVSHFTEEHSEGLAVRGGGDIGYLHISLALPFSVNIFLLKKQHWKVNKIVKKVFRIK